MGSLPPRSPLRSCRRQNKAVQTFSELFHHRPVAVHVNLVPYRSSQTAEQRSLRDDTHSHTRDPTFHLYTAEGSN